MAFLYPAASISIIKGNAFYRIKAQAVDAQDSSLTSLGPGDLIPVDVGFSAIAVGPESDYEKYELFYSDPTAPGGVQKIPFSKDAPFIGRITADNATAFPGSDGELGKVFIRIADIGTLQSATSGAPAEVAIAEALADIIVYTGEVPSFLPTKRVPKIRSSNVSLEIPLLVPYSFLIPGYGRRLLSVTLNKMSIPVATVISATVEGIRLYNPLVSTAAGDGLILSGKTVDQLSITELLASTVVPNTPDTLSFAYNADVDGDGYFDMYRVFVTTDVNVLASDSQRGQGFRVNLEVRD